MVCEGSQDAILSYLKEKVSKSSVQYTPCMKHPLWEMVYEGFRTAILLYLKEKVSKSSMQYTLA
jgi:hypothetical protein